MPCRRLVQARGGAWGPARAASRCTSWSSGRTPPEGCPGTGSKPRPLRQHPSSLWGRGNGEGPGASARLRLRHWSPCSTGVACWALSMAGEACCPLLLPA